MTTEQRSEIYTLANVMGFSVFRPFRAGDGYRLIRHGEPEESAEWFRGTLRQIATWLQGYRAANWEE